VKWRRCYTTHPEGLWQRHYRPLTTGRFKKELMRAQSAQDRSTRQWREFQSPSGLARQLMPESCPELFPKKNAWRRTFLCVLQKRQGGGLPPPRFFEVNMLARAFLNRFGHPNMLARALYNRF
jgi:hypothetical protein